jgi:Ca-activated chloride channel family protein|tara:strand:- start:394 stop:1320 length:927 start_codon:yes stop_codon:yes gene_type:complete
MARYWSVAVVVILISSMASALQPTFTSRIDLVHVSVIVLDRDGTPVTGLDSSDFELLEDGELQEVSYFARGLSTDNDVMPVHLGLLLDASGSMAQDDRFQKTAAIKFLRALDFAADTTIVDFDTEVRVGRYGRDGFPRLVERIRGSRPSGETALYDALGVYLDGAFEQDGRKILVLYTDGEDTRSQMTFEDARDLLRASDVTVYAIGLQRYLRASSRQRQRLFLEELTDSTGGRAYFPQDTDELDGIYEQIEAELNARYSIGFISTNEAMDGGWRELEVRLRSPSESLQRADIRSRDGYYAVYVEEAR